MENLTVYTTELENPKPPFYSYEYLSDEAKKRAMKAIIAEDMKVFKKKCYNYYFKGQHVNIPNTDHIKKHDDIEYMENYIEENVCKFLKDGTYVRYSR
jgi:hypothetical protein